MSARETLLLELGCEEIPARMLPAATHALAEVLVRLLDKAGLAHGSPMLYWSPRRLAVRIPETQTASQEREDTLLGPPARAAWDAEGRPTRAAEGFARKQGVEASTLRRVETDKGSYAAAVVTRPRRGLGELLAPGFEKAVRAISFPKTMRWGEGLGPFVRPVHWLLALAGEELLDLSLFGVTASRQTRAHRALSPEPITIPSAELWEMRLAEAGVVVDPAVRRHRLHEALRARAAELGGELREDELLLVESADMVELPAAIAGSFEQKFVDELPEEVLQTCLKHHQKAFSLAKDGVALAAFAVAVNMPEDPEGHIRRGHEWVNSGRLEDALFFWREDRKRPLESRAAQLAEVVFQAELGSYAAKSSRLARLACTLGKGRGFSASELADLEHAARLSRCDLVSGLVGEFPELQGVAGGLLGRADGLPEAVCEAIYSFYRPSSAEDALPDGEAGRLLGLADRLDTLAGGFAVGLEPSGSKDPFALRRAGMGAVRLAAACDIDLRAALDEALRGYIDEEGGPVLGERAEKVRPRLVSFLLERFGALAEREGARYDEVNALRSPAAERFLPGDLLERARALRRFREKEDFLALASAAKRVRNILVQAAARGDAVVAGQGSEALAEPAEKELASLLSRCEKEVASMRAAARYTDALGALAALRPAVDRFFEEILVMDEDATLRSARLGLLAVFDLLAQGIVDLSELVVEGHG